MPQSQADAHWLFFLHLVTCLNLGFLRNEMLLCLTIPTIAALGAQTVVTLLRTALQVTSFVFDVDLSSTDRWLLSALVYLCLLEEVFTKGFTTGMSALSSGFVRSLGFTPRSSRISKKKAKKRSMKKPISGKQSAKYSDL